MINNISQYKYIYSGKYPQRYKIFILNNKENINLKTQLTQDGFFDFYILNNGHVVSYHQIVAFYFCGGKEALKRNMQAPSNLYEVHHIDGNTLNNNSTNLVIIPKILHLEITKAQRRINKYIKVFSKQCGNYLISSLPICFNTQGRLVFNKLKWLLKLFVRTVSMSFLFFKPLTISFTSSIKLWLRKTLKSLKTGAPIGKHIQDILILN